MELWEKIRLFPLDDPSAQFRFSDRLARENGWTLLYAFRAMEEYKRFMFLVCCSPQALTPSDAVDQVWHLHLLYTESYWVDFCEKTLGRPIHHGPTKGGPTERSNYRDRYSDTLARYAETFGQAPPPDIWPTPEVRFSDIHFRRVNLKKFWVIRRLF